MGVVRLVQEARLGSKSIMLWHAVYGAGASRISAGPAEMAFSSLEDGMKASIAT